MKSKAKSSEADGPADAGEDLGAIDRLMRATALSLSRRRFLGGVLGGGTMVLISRLGGVGGVSRAYAQGCMTCYVGFCAVCQSCFNGSCCSPGNFCSSTDFCCTCNLCDQYCQNCGCSTFEASYTVCDNGATAMGCPDCYL